MNLSCLPVTLYDDIFSGKSTVIDWIRFGAELGLDAVDFSIKFFPRRDSEAVKQIRSVLEKHDMRVCMLACYPDFTHPNETQRDQELSNLKADISLAKALGAEFVRVTAGQNHPGIERKKGVQWVTAGFRHALDVAEDCGITLAYENHTKGAPWQYWDFSQRAEVFLEILSELSDTPLGVCFDTANPLVLKEDVLELLDKVIDRVVVLHVFDLREIGSFEPVCIGTGAAPIPEVLSRMQEANFDGWVSIEEASRQGRQGFEQAIRFVRQGWKDAVTA